MVWRNSSKYFATGLTHWQEWLGSFLPWVLQEEAWHEYPFELPPTISYPIHPCQRQQEVQPPCLSRKTAVVILPLVVVADWGMPMVLPKGIPIEA